MPYNSHTSRYTSTTSLGIGLISDSPHPGTWYVWAAAVIGAPRIRARSRSSASNAHSVTGSEAASGADRTTGAPMTLNMEHIYHVMPQYVLYLLV